MNKKSTKREAQDIQKLVSLYKDKQYLFNIFLKGVTDVLSTHPLLIPHLHSVKNRLKSVDSLEHKLYRKLQDSKIKKVKFSIGTSNLFDEIQDLAGVRLLHLHTDQVGVINNAILKIIKEQNYTLVEGPIANTWDDEYRALFDKLKIESKPRDSMYTSIHYIVAANTTDKVRCEIQVRTLLEEVWGEVSHLVNYPEKTASLACSEQLKVLARVTSSGTRLVDSIFISKKEYDSL